MKQYAESTRRVTRTTGEWLGALALLFAVQAYGQSPINVQITGLGCPGGSFTAPMWWLGDHDSLFLVKQFDACSPALFAAGAMQRHFSTLKLTEGPSTSPQLVLTLSDVIVTRYDLEDSHTTGVPNESLKILYKNSTITTAPFQGLIAGQSSTSVHVSNLGCAFNALTWGFDLSSPVSLTTLGGWTMTGSRTQFADLSITKPVDSCSKALALARQTQQHIDTVTLTTQVNGNSGPLLTITLNEVTVSGVYPGSGSSTEGLSIKYGRISVTDVPQKVTAAWDILTNRLN